MQFGHFSLMGYRTAGTPSHEILDDTVAQVKAAEAAGFEIAWFAEHHFSNYCICPSPLMMVARSAGETARIRLGSAVVVVPLYHPARLLAEIGMVDALSHGRFVLGLGSGYQPYEFERFGENLAASKAKLEEFLDMYERAFAGETFTYEGTHYRLPETHIATRPYGPLPPVWLAGDNPELHRMAARRGYVPMIGTRNLTGEQLAAMRRSLDQTFGAEGRETPAPLAILRHACVTDSRDEAMAFLEETRHQLRLSASLRRREEVVNGAMLEEKPFPGEPSLDDLARHLPVGDPAQVAERLADTIRHGRPSHMLLQFQVGDWPQAKALASIERFGSEVRPLLEASLGPLDATAAPSGDAAQAHRSA